MNELLHKELSNKIIKCFYTVYNTLGFGFLEKVYENALIIELVKNGLKAEKQKPIKVLYDSQIVGEYFADVIVEDSIILELKAAEFVIEEHELQLINYLKATEKEIGLLLNFGKTPEFKRKIFTNDRKKLNTDNTDSTDNHGSV
ncbi:MAG: GxxExxY protein [Bacteroidia bacterium]|nr:GxxExxY protein [Bacteroidia bacterium]